MDSNWQLMKEGIEGTPKVHEWIQAKLNDGDSVGYDPTYIAASLYKTLSTDLKKVKSISMKTVEPNLVDVIWADERPKRPTNNVTVLDMKYAGETCASKLRRLREEMKKKDAALLVLSALDDIAWTFNLRGSDIPYNPVFFAYAIIDHKNALLFLSPEQQQSAGLREHLAEAGVQLQPYDAIVQQLNTSYESISGGNQRVWLPAPTVSQALAAVIDPDCTISDTSPATELKSQKNEVELNGFRHSHIKDAVAHCEFLHWLEGQMGTNRTVTEVSAADKFEEFRSKQADYVSLSFPTISAVGANAAQPHYHTSRDNDVPLQHDAVYLCDSGGQYLDGTTDVTRTLVWNHHSEDFLLRRAYTLVLKGHIALARQKFPEGTVGIRLDTIARSELWNLGLDYGHGTGHGVGHYLNVHEGPFSIGYRGGTAAQNGLKSGMVTSIEPGYYDDAAKFGIRIENLYIVRETHTEYGERNPEKKFLRFEPITLVPIQLALLDPTLLSYKEVNWLNFYHTIVDERVGAELERQGKAEVRAWLRSKCAPLDVAKAVHHLSHAAN